MGVGLGAVYVQTRCVAGWPVVYRWCDMSSDGGDDDHDDAQHIASCVSCHSEYIDVCTHPDAPLDTPPGQWLWGGAGTGLLHPSG